MDFERPENTESCEGIEGTVILPTESNEYPDALFEQVPFRRDGRRPSPELTQPLFESGDGYYDLNVEALAQVLWEHRQYSRAQDFSPSQLDVLRALQISSQQNERVLFNEITDQLDYEDPTVSQALSKLQDRGLVVKEGRGVYRYNGFEDLTPAMESDRDETTG